MTEGQKASTNVQKEETQKEEVIKTTFEEVTGVGVLVTKIYGSNISTVFVPGTKLKDEKIVSLLVD